MSEEIDYEIEEGFSYNSINIECPYCENPSIWNEEDTQECSLCNKDYTVLKLKNGRKTFVVKSWITMEVECPYCKEPYQSWLEWDTQECEYCGKIFNVKDPREHK